MKSSRGLLGPLLLSADHSASAERTARDIGMAEFTGRDLHLVKKALAIAALAIKEQPGPVQSGSDLSGMKALLDEIIENDVELAYDARAARIAVTGAPD
jgi:hypothetical protein